MISEDIRLKESAGIKMNPKFRSQDENNDDKTTVENEKIIKTITPLVNMRRITIVSESIINYFSIGVCFVIYGLYGLEWLKVSEEENRSFYLGYFLVSGIILYVIGIFDWYEGKELIFLIDFIMSFLFLTLFFKYQELGFITDTLGFYDNDKLQSIFYILFFCFIFVIGISSKDKGLIYIINYASLFVTYAFLFVYKYFKNDIIKIISCYIFIVVGAFFWITGILKLMNNMLSSTLRFMEPSD
jgi:hypothetical protein